MPVQSFHFSANDSGVSQHTATAGKQGHLPFSLRLQFGRDCADIALRRPSHYLSQRALALPGNVLQSLVQLFR